MNRALASALLTALAVGGCASAPARPFARANLEAAPTAVPLPNSSVAPIPQEPSLPLGTPTVAPIPDPVPEPEAPETRVQIANAAARVEPSRPDYDQAAQVYAFAPHALYQVYAAPGRVTDIALQPGERLSDQGAIAAGDTARWIIGEAVSGAGDAARTHVLVKPTRPDLATNLVIHTDRRTYLLELQARPNIYMASVAWRYPRDEALTLGQTAAKAAAVESEPRFDPDSLNFDYRIEGDAVAWRPVHVFDDGRRVFISFGSGADHARLPPLYVAAADHDAVALVNYRIEAGRMVVDRLFDQAELRLVEGRNEKVVRIRRAGGRP